MVARGTFQIGNYGSFQICDLSISSERLLLRFQKTIKSLNLDHQFRTLVTEDKFILILIYVILSFSPDDRWPRKDRPSSGEEPDWIKSDKEQFKTHRDKNHDGRLSREELANWMSPIDYDPTLAEARHLIHHADADKVGV